ncbi:hypothetical protein FRC03_006715 [Tulasnella sp. 419]|nr:hypothetical protein FRC03_006715 [Tulasnella sp. 419]
MHFLALPLEIISSILLELDWKDLIQCQSLCKFIDDLFRTTTAIRYKIQLGRHCMIHNPSIDTHSSSKRLEKLGEFTNAWATLKATRTTSFKIPSYWSVYDLQQGIFVHGVMDSTVDLDEANHLHHECTTALRFYKFPSTLGDSDDYAWSFPSLGIPVNEMTIDPSMDLLVLLEKPSVQPPSLPSWRGQVNLSIHLRTMTRNEPHPLARKAVLTQRHEIKWEESFDSYAFSLRGSRLVLVVVSCGLNYGDEFYVIWIWNWRTGVLEFEYADQGYAALSFLTDRSFLVSHHAYGELEWGLDVHFITNDEPVTTDQGLKTRVVTLLLPKLQSSRILVEGIICRSVPNQASRILDNHGGSAKLGILPESGGQRINDPKPFRTSPVNQLVVVSFNICRLSPQGDSHLSIEGSFEEFTLITRADLLVAVASEAITKNEAVAPLEVGESSRLTVEWNDWGPMSSRFEQERGCGVSKFVCCTSGPRFLTWSRMDMESFVIWDFNPYCLEIRTGPRSLDMEQKPYYRPTVVRSDFFHAYEVLTCLPYRETRLPIKQKFISSVLSREDLDFMLDEENFIVLTKVDHSDTTDYTVYTL